MAMVNLRNSFGVVNVVLLAAVLTLTGCGGAVSPSSGSSPTPTPTGTPTVTVSLADPATGAARTSISSTSPATVNAVVKDSSGNAAANSVVTFAIAPAGLVSMTPSSGTALTNGSGVASIQISPADFSASGAATVTASGSVGGANATGSSGFSIGATSVALTGLTVAQNPLSAYGTSGVTVNVNVGGALATTPVTVNFSSVCSTSPSGTGTAMKATLSPSVQSVNGVATATYTDNGCGTTDTITASTTGAPSVHTTLPVAAAGAATIKFISATPSTIVLKGTGGGGLSESSAVVFQVVDTGNTGIANQSVTLDLTTRTGGILLDNSAGAVVKQTDPNGKVTVNVTAGTNPTAVGVTASTTSGGITFNTQSSVLTISTGRAAQDRFSLSVGTFNIEGWSHDGVTTPLTVIASDRVGNPVPDGTAVNFVTEGAQVTPSICTTISGTCTVTFKSSNPRPVGDSIIPLISGTSTPVVTAGRVTVLAYALGEESFIDKNKDNIYELGEPFNDLGDVYVDFNENGVADVGETQIPFKAGNTSLCTWGIGSPYLTSPPAPYVAGTCDGVWGPAHVRQDAVITLSGSSAYVENDVLVRTYPASHVGPFALADGSCTQSFWLYDVNHNPMPAGTTVSIANVTPSGVSVTVGGGSPVVSTAQPGGTLVAVHASPAPCTGLTFTINVQTPLGLVTGISATMN
jgi:hypothetical protein